LPEDHIGSHIETLARGRFRANNMTTKFVSSNSDTFMTKSSKARHLSLYRRDCAVEIIYHFLAINFIINSIGG